jgi:hypothetical protein
VVVGMMIEIVPGTGRGIRGGIGNVRIVQTAGTEIGIGMVGIGNTSKSKLYWIE